MESRRGRHAYLLKVSVIKKLADFSGFAGITVTIIVSVCISLFLHEVNSMGTLWKPENARVRLLYRESASVFEGHRSCVKLKIIFQARHGFICDQRATVSGDLKTVLAAY